MMFLRLFFLFAVFFILAGRLSANVVYVEGKKNGLFSIEEEPKEHSESSQSSQRIGATVFEEPVGSCQGCSEQTGMLKDSVDRTEKKEMKQRKGNFFTRFVKSFNDMDTTYIIPNHYNYTAMIQNTNFRQVYRLRGSNDNTDQMIHLSPEPAFKIGPYFGWRWIFLGYTFDLGHPRKAGKTSEFNLSLYSSMLGVDLIYIKNSGDFKIKKIDGFGSTQLRNVDFNGFNANTSCLNAYYVFNHKRFSYPAAFAQSTVQRKSCGTWILGIRFDKQKMSFDYKRLPQEMIKPNEPDGVELVDQLKFNELNYKHYSISGGYAYNWVFAKNCLLSLSLVPAVGYKQAKGERITGERFWVNIKNFNVDFITRAGLVWNNSRWFAGASFVNHLYDYRRSQLSLSNSVSYLSFYFGLCFSRRK